MIHYIQPYSTAKNIGGAINLAIESLLTTDGDWIVLLDHDVMFLRPDSKWQIETFLEKTDIHILGCKTNRLALPYQLEPGMFEETDILKHIAVANELFETRRWNYLITREPLAAMMLCFKVSTWKRLGRFDENILSFDTTFCNRAILSKLTLGVMLGVYVFHLYRMGIPGEARLNYKHLLP